MMFFFPKKIDKCLKFLIDVFVLCHFLIPKKRFSFFFYGIFPLKYSIRIKEKNATFIAMKHDVHNVMALSIACRLSRFFISIGTKTLNREMITSYHKRKYFIIC
jgi:hypothetical protein